ncbi:penicillin-binding protein [bacterium]|nr:penicillin-binding protein [bacterium]
MPIPQLKNKKYYQSWKDQGKKSKTVNLKNYKRKTFNKKKSVKDFIFNKKVLKVCLGLFLIGVIFVGIVLISSSRNLPDPNQLLQREVVQSTKIYDRTGENLLYEIYGEEQRTLATLEEIPDYMEEATVAMEDKNFYNHGGFSLWAIFRTIITDVIYRKKAGASTITQQLVKNAILTPEKTYTRKIKELILAYKIEQNFSKKEILQMYLNEIPYGGTAYGVEAASRHYFGKNVKDINLAEAAILTALPQAPSYYSPYGPNKELLIQRKDYILKIMLEQGYINEEELEEAKNYELKFREPRTNITAPHFVMYVKSKLSEKYGEKMIEQGGLKIYTTLDLYKQKIAEEVIGERVEKNINNYNATNAGLISIDPKNGQVLAMVGSRDYFDDTIDGKFNITTSNRQPGSSIKPIVYASAFEKGFTPNTKLFDVVTNFSNNPSQPYEPQNYNLKEYGPISIRKALSGSLNIPAVKALYLAGMDNVIDLIKKMGYSTFSDKNRFGLSLVLGGGEVKLIEHTNAYSAFAREGLIHPISVIIKIEDSNGNILEEFKSKEERVLSAESARMINSILTDNNARSFTYGLDNWLTLNSRLVAAKTGTTNDYRDAWTIGYTPSIVTGVWVGNNDNEKMKSGASGGSVAAPIWNVFMDRVLGDTPAEKFNKLGDIKTNNPAIDGTLEYKKTIKIDEVSGLLATEDTPTEYIKEIEIPVKPHSILYYIDKNNPLGESPESPENDHQFNLWEEAVNDWFIKNSTSTSSTTIPTEYDNIHGEEYKPELSIIKPDDKQIIISKNINVEIKTSAIKGIGRAEYYINNFLFYTNNSYPFNMDKDISFLNNGYHDLKVRVCDLVGNCSEKNIVFNLSLSENKNNQEIKTSWLKPQKNISLNPNDLPYEISLTATPYKKIVKIEFVSFYSPSSTSNIIYQTNQINSVIGFTFNNPGKGGTYQITPKIFTWDGNIKEASSVYVTIN